MSNSTNTQSIADYLAQLLKDKKALAAFPNVFLHLERLLDDGKILKRGAGFPEVHLASMFLHEREGEVGHFIRKFPLS